MHELHFTRDYHEEMIGETFQEWFEEILL